MSADTGGYSAVPVSTSTPDAPSPNAGAVVPEAEDEGGAGAGDGDDGGDGDGGGDDGASLLVGCGVCVKSARHVASLCAALRGWYVCQPAVTAAAAAGCR